MPTAPEATETTAGAGSADPGSTAADPDAAPTRAPRGRSGAEQTRARIVEAALQTLRDEGIAGISARAVARRGDFNQALIFYHFGSVEGLLVAVARSESERRSALYAPALAEVDSLSELVAVARRLHDEEFEAGTVAALTQVLAGAVGSEDLSQGIAEGLRPWTDLVGDTVDRLLGGTPFHDLLPRDDLTTGLAALFLGIELLTGLQPGVAGGSLFDTMASVARVMDGLIQSGSGARPS